MSVDFDDTSNYYALSGVGSTTSRTFMLWFKQRSGAVSGNLFDFADSGATQFQRMLLSSSLLGARAGGGGSDTFFGASPTLGGWICIAYVCTGTGANQVSVYWRQQGDASFTSMTMTEVAFTAATLLVNNLASGSVCSYYDQKEWSVGLTLSELNAEYASFAPVKSANLFRWIKLDTGANTGIDSSGNGFDMSVTGTPTTGADNPTFPSVAYVDRPLNRGISRGVWHG